MITPGAVTKFAYFKIAYPGIKPAMRDGYIRVDADSLGPEWREMCRSGTTHAFEVLHTRGESPPTYARVQMDLLRRMHGPAAQEIASLWNAFSEPPALSGGESDRKSFDEVFDAVFEGLRAFHSCLTDETKQATKVAVVHRYADTGCAQATYERLQDAIEAELAKNVQDELLALIEANETPRG